MTRLAVELPGSSPRRACRRRGARARGFSLIELMVTIALAAILVSLAGPSMVRMLRGNRIQTEVSAFVSDLQYARTEAVKRGQTVSVCPSSDGTTCLATNTWHSGWLVFYDVNLSPGTTCSYDTSAGDLALRKRATLSSGDTVVASPGKTCISFNREGFTSNLGTASVVFPFHTADNNSLATRCVTLDLGGRISTRSVGGTCT